MPPYSQEKPSSCVEFTGFEGPEKRLELDFCRVEGCELGFRQFKADRWNQVLKSAQCTIISEKSNEYFDAYLLSESSLFVYPFKIMIKTCGTTTPLEILPDVLSMCNEIQTHIEFFQYSRSDFIFPDKQPHPHNSWDNEVSFIREYFPDSQSFVFGSLEGSRWHLCLADFTPDTRPLEAEMDQTIELVFYDIDKSVLRKFWKNENYLSAEDTTRRSGIRDLLPRATIDDFVFDPCGYSMNGLQGPTYYTIHITPEEECSFISFETNAKKGDYTALVYNLLQTFKPGSFSIMLFADDGSNAGRSQRALQLRMPGFKLENMTTNKFCGNYNLTACSFVADSGDDNKSSISTTSLCEQPLKLTMRMRALSLEDFEREKRSHDVSAAIRAVINEFDAEIVEKKDTSIVEFIQRMVLDHSLEDPFFVMDLAALAQRLKLWQQCFSRVRPYYAVKCNPDPAIIKLLAALGCGFDCASMSEISDVLSLGVSPSSIIFANPCKMPSHLRYARERGARVMTFDSPAELHKVKSYFPDAQLVLRLSTNDTDATCRLSNKYGAHIHEVSSLLTTAKHLNLAVIGVSFHVGSGQPLVEPWRQAIRDARHAFDLMEARGMKPWLLDIGGGFPGSDGAGTCSIQEISAALNPLIDELFPANVMVISEPGRFFAEGCYTLATCVIGKRWATDGNAGTTDARVAKYFVNDGIYGSFNCLMYDHANINPIPLRVASAGETPRRECNSCLFGPTCDGLDCIVTGAFMEELDIGDWVLFPNMGAYTIAATSRFNGFHAPQTFYVMTAPSVRDSIDYENNSVEIVLGAELKKAQRSMLPSLLADEANLVEDIASIRVDI